MHRIHGLLPSQPLQREFSRLFSFSCVLFSLNQQFATFRQMRFIKIAINDSKNANDGKTHLRNMCVHFMAEMHTTLLHIHAGVSTQPKRS